MFTRRNSVNTGCDYGSCMAQRFFFRTKCNSFITSVCRRGAQNEVNVTARVSFIHYYPGNGAAQTVLGVQVSIYSYTHPASYNGYDLMAHTWAGGERAKRERGRDMGKGSGVPTKPKASVSLKKREREKKIKFLVVFWNEVRHEAPHCTR